FGLTERPQAHVPSAKECDRVEHDDWEDEVQSLVRGQGRAAQEKTAHDRVARPLRARRLEEREGSERAEHDEGRLLRRQERVRSEGGYEGREDRRERTVRTSREPSTDEERRVNGEGPVRRPDEAQVHV